MLSNTGGGLLRSGRMKRSEQSDLPEVRPMKPMPPQAPPSQAPQGMPPQGAPQGMPQAPMPPQGGMPQGMPPDPQGMPQGGMPEQGINDIANNALALLHDEQFAAQAEQMIASGEEGAANVAAMVGEQIVNDYRAQGMEPDIDNSLEAMMEVVGDVADIGMGMGSLPQEPVIDGVPASVYAIMSYTADKLTAKFPEFGQSLKNMAQQEAAPEDDNAARQVAAYMKQRGQNVQS